MKAIALAFAILVATYSDGYELHVPSTTMDVCATAISAIHRGWLSLEREGHGHPTGLRCQEGNEFTPEEMCIKGYNCPKK